MRRYNPKILKAIFEICERNRAIAKVGPDYYEAFINFSDNDF